MPTSLLSYALRSRKKKKKGYDIKGSGIRGMAEDVGTAGKQAVKDIASAGKKIIGGISGAFTGPKNIKTGAPKKPKPYPTPVRFESNVVKQREQERRVAEDIDRIYTRQRSKKRKTKRR